MSKKFQLQIPEPCHENWDKMTPEDKGRFCDSCQKAVVDFTGMSDSQLVAFFKKPSTGSVCGRFFNDQLARDIEMPGKRLPWLKYFFQFTIPVFFTTLKTQAQEHKLLKTRLIPETSVTCNNRVTVGMVYYPTDSKKMFGIVTDENGKGIPFASVFLKGMNKGTSCDSLGFFKMEVPISEKKITFIASCVSYLEQEKEINTRKNDFVEIKLTTNAVLNGEVVVTSSLQIKGRVVTTGYTVTSIKTEEKTLLKKIKSLFINDSARVSPDIAKQGSLINFVNDSIRIFPNPAKVGNQIKIEWKKAKEGNVIIDLYNMQGQLIKSVAAEIQFEKNIITYHLPVVTPSAYILQLTNTRTGKRHSEQIIIQ